MCLICWTPKYCRHPSSSSFRCCPTWFFNVIQGVLYPHTCIIPCLSNTFCWKYRGCNCPSFVKTNCLLVKLVHLQHSCYASPNNVELLEGSWDICSPQLCSHHLDLFWPYHLSYQSVSIRCMQGTFPLHLFEFLSSSHLWCLDKMRCVWTMQSIPK